MTEKFANNAQSTLAGALSAGATSFSVTPGDGAKFPAITAPDYFHVTLIKLNAGVPVHEIVKVTARSGDSFTVVRGQQGTAATTFSSSDRVENRMTADSMDKKADASALAAKADKILYTDNAAANTINLAGAGSSNKRWAPATGAQTLTITNWPVAGEFGELLIEGVNLGASTITTPSSIKWIKSDGTFATNNSLNTNHGATLQTAGLDFVYLFSRDGGATVYGKVIR